MDDHDTLEDYVLRLTAEGYPWSERELELLRRLGLECSVKRAARPARLLSIEDPDELHRETIRILAERSW